MSETDRQDQDRPLDYALCLFAASVFFSVTLVQAALFLVLILLARRGLGGGTLPALKTALPSHPLFPAWALYLAVCLLTALTAYYPQKGLGQLNSDFLKFLCLFTLLFSVTARRLPLLTAFYAAGAAAAAAGGIGETLLSLLRGADAPARAGFLMNAVRYGESMAIALFLPLSLLLAAPPSRRAKAAWAAAAALVALALLASQTRGAWLGAAAGCASLFAFAPAARRRLAAAAACLLLGAALLAALSPALRARAAAMVSFRSGDFSANSANTGINVRLELWKLGGKMLAAHPVVGVGPDNVKKVFKKFHPEPFPEEGIYGTLNSIYVHQAAERGLLGLGALLFLFLSMFLFALARWRSTASPYALWAVGALPAFYFVNLTEISFQHVHTAFAVFLALAFAAAAGKETV